MGSNRPFLLFGAVIVLVFTVGMLITHPSLRPPLEAARAWFSDEHSAWRSYL